MGKKGSLGLSAWLKDFLRETIIQIVILLLISAGAIYYLRDLLISTRIPLFWILISFLAGGVIIHFVHRLKLKKGLKKFVFRAREGDEVEIPFKFFKVKWIAYIPPHREDEYVWLNGPYCPKCNMELDWKHRGWVIKKFLWKCKRCFKEFLRPRMTKAETEDFVEDLIYAEIYRKEKFPKK